MIISPMIIFMGIQAKKYGLSNVAADKALIIMGVIIFIISFITVIGIVC